MTYEEAKEMHKGCTRGSRGHRKWPDSYSSGECDFLSVFYLEISDEDMAFILGRSKKSIIVKRLSLGLCRPRGYEIPPLKGEKKIIEAPEPEKPVEKASFRDECRAKGMSYAEMQIAERLMQAKQDLGLSEFAKRQNIKRQNIKPIWADGIFKKQEGKMGNVEVYQTDSVKSPDHYKTCEVQDD